MSEPKFGGKDQTGVRYGMLTVEGGSRDPAPSLDIWGEWKWNCACDCGSKVRLCTAALKFSKAPSCGCRPNVRGKPAKALDLHGATVGRLTVIELVPGRKGRSLLWSCLCSCGRKTVVTASDLSLRRTKSCGCLGKENRDEWRYFPYHRQTPFESNEGTYA
jgi:hypothetical protein